MGMWEKRLVSDFWAGHELDMSMEKGEKQVEQ